MMSQNPTTVIRVDVINLETMQCLPHCSLLAEISVSMQLPPIKQQKLVLAPVRDQATTAPQLGQNNGKKETVFFQTLDIAAKVTP